MQTNRLLYTTLYTNKTTTTTRVLFCMYAYCVCMETSIFFSRINFMHCSHSQFWRVYKTSFGDIWRRDVAWLCWCNWNICFGTESDFRSIRASKTTENEASIWNEIEWFFFTGRPMKPKPIQQIARAHV